MGKPSKSTSDVRFLLRRVADQIPLRKDLSSDGGLFRIVVSFITKTTEPELLSSDHVHVIPPLSVVRMSDGPRRMRIPGLPC